MSTPCPLPLLPEAAPLGACLLLSVCPIALGNDYAQKALDAYDPSFQAHSAIPKKTFWGLPKVGVAEKCFFCPNQLSQIYVEPLRGLGRTHKPLN